MGVSKFLSDTILLCMLLTSSVFGSAPLHIELKSPQESAGQPSAEVHQLLGILRDVGLQKSDPERVRSAILRLGELRVKEPVDDLVRVIDFKYEFWWEKRPGLQIQPIGRGVRYPAIDALFQIGKPALPALVEAVAVNPHNSLAHRNGWEAIMLIFRDDVEAGVHFIREAADNEKVPERAMRLRQAASQAEKQIVNQLKEIEKKSPIKRPSPSANQ